MKAISEAPEKDRLDVCLLVLESMLTIWFSAAHSVEANPEAFEDPEGFVDRVEASVRKDIDTVIKVAREASAEPESRKNQKLVSTEVGSVH
jgi:hypothetical protein